MISTKKILILCVLSFISIDNARPSLVESGNIDEINTLLEKEKLELNKLKEEIAKQTGILNKMGKKEYSYLKKQRILDSQLKIRERELKIYDWNLKINKNKISNLTKKLNQSEKQIYLQQQIMRSRIRTIYKEGKLFPVKMLFSSEDFVDLLKRAKYLDSVMAYDRLIFTNYERELEDFHSEKESLLHAKGKLLLYKNKASAKKKEIVFEKEKKKQFLVKLIKEKIPFRIVPGITAEIGGIAYAGIPATYRNNNHSITLITGHRSLSKSNRSINWKALSKSTEMLVFYMVLGNLGYISKALIKAGRKKNESVALISSATTAKQKTVITTLENCSNLSKKYNLKTPTMLVVGKNVSLRKKLKWVE